MPQVCGPKKKKTKGGGQKKKKKKKKKDEDVVCIYNKNYSAITKDKIMPSAAAWIELEILILGEVSQKKEKCHIISLTCGI